MPRTTPPSKYNHGFPLLDDQRFLNLPHRRRRFVYNYYLKQIKPWTNADCYRMAMCKLDMASNSANANACLLLKDPSIAPLINAIDQHEIECMGVTLQKILIEEMAIATSDLAELFDEHGTIIDNPKKLPLSVRKALKSIKLKEDRDGRISTEYRLWDKGQALSRLTNLQGLQSPKRVEISGPNQTPIQTHNQIDLSNLTNDELAVVQKLAGDTNDQ